MYYNLFSTIQIYYKNKKKQNNVTFLHLFLSTIFTYIKISIKYFISLCLY